MTKKLKNVKKYTIKKVTIDPLYTSYWYSKFLNKLMLSGKKHIIQKIMSRIFFRFKVKLKTTPVLILFSALIKIRPYMGIIKKRLGRIWKEVPFPLEPRRQLVIALKWLVAEIKLDPSFALRVRILSVLKILFKKVKKKKYSQRSAVRNREAAHTRTILTNKVNQRFRWK